MHLYDTAEEDDPFAPITADDLHELFAELGFGYKHRVAAFTAMLLASMDQTSACNNGTQR